ncbi:unnamed protein product [Pieris macdunnoughi]|uniref:Uncharacterized protein n=1 Tax=Pieris macdunnoughi TaxID=345717 RepID=A0A821WBV4_9NEOP|nr:unnamed protein product [Pieris macdunnoughi]
MIFNIFFGLFCFVPVRFIESYTLHLKFNELKDSPRTQNKDSEIITKELLDNIINIAEKHQHGLTDAIHKCILEEKTKAKKLLCIHNLEDKRNARSWHQQDSIQDTVETSKLADLSRSLVAKLNLDKNGFADDYIDFLSLREGKEDGRRANDFVLKKILRTNTDSDSDSSDSDLRIKKYKHSLQAKRFKPKKIVRKDPYRYMQGPSRIYEMNLDRRRRLPHFLPKRHYWDENDFKELKNYWIHGPQGKYPGAYRIPY